MAYYTIRELWTMGVTCPRPASIRVPRTCILRGNITFGNHVKFGDFVVLNASDGHSINMEDNIEIGPHVSIVANNNDIWMGSNIKLGSGSRVLGGARIFNNTTIEANDVVKGTD